MLNQLQITMIRVLVDGIQLSVNSFHLHSALFSREVFCVMIVALLFWFVNRKVSTKGGREKTPLTPSLCAFLEKALGGDQDKGQYRGIMTGKVYGPNGGNSYGR
jgi:hypothetical protein